MLNYKLCKQLKDVGYPLRRGDGKEICLHGVDESLIHMFGCGKRIYQPTLSELIQESMKELSNIYPLPSITFRKRNNKWVCSSDSPKVWDWAYVGKTPEEAVARLYLELKNGNK